MPRLLRNGPYTSQLPSWYISRSARPTLRPSISAGPARWATAMNLWNIERLIAPASSMRIITLVSRPSNTRGGAK